MKGDLQETNMGGFPAKGYDTKEIIENAIAKSSRSWSRNSRGFENLVGIVKEYFQGGNDFAFNKFQVRGGQEILELRKTDRKAGYLFFVSKSYRAELNAIERKYDNEKNRVTFVKINPISGLAGFAWEARE